MRAVNVASYQASRFAQFLAILLVRNCAGKPVATLDHASIVRVHTSSHGSALRNIVMAVIGQSRPLADWLSVWPPIRC